MASSLGETTGSSSAESTKASAYLSLDEAEQVANGLYGVVERIRTARAGREVTAGAEGGDDG